MRINLLVASVLTLLSARTAFGELNPGPNDVYIPHRRQRAGTVRHRQGAR
jgi:hypothetical protein